MVLGMAPDPLGKESGLGRFRGFLRLSVVAALGLELQPPFMETAFCCGL